MHRAGIGDLILFQDTFGYPYPDAALCDGTSSYFSDVNSNIDYAGRQSGSLVDPDGPIGYT
jgi:hypothetical protein